MKTYEEMTRCALEARDEHEKKRKRNIYIAKRAVPAFAGVFAAFIIGFGVWNNLKKPDTLPAPDNVVESVTTTSPAVLPHSSETTVTALTTTTTAANTTSAAGNTTTTGTDAAKTETSAVTSTTESVQAQQASTHEAATTTAVHTTVTTMPRTTTATTTAEPPASFTTTTDIRASGTAYGGIPGGASGDPSGGDMAVGGGSAPSAGSSDPWYDLPVHKRYYNAFLDGYVAELTPAYRGGYPISSDWIGDHISGAKMKSQFRVEGVVKQCTAEAYYIKGYSDENVVAIKFEGYDEYYLYHTDNTDLNSLMKQIPPLES